MSDEVWSEITVPTGKETEKVEYEVEGQEEEKDAAKEPQEKEEVVETASEDSSWIDAPEEDKNEEKETEPKELEGVQTKGAQKRIRQLVKQRKERDEQIQQLIQQNEQLNHKLIGREKEFTQAQEITTETSQKQLQDSYSLARENYLEAYQSGDAEKVLKAQEALNQSQRDLENVGATKAALEKYKQEVELHEKQLQHQAATKPAADPKAVRWASNNEWFGKDNVMTAAALAIDSDLKNLGLDPSSDDFYIEVDKRLQESFPHKFEEGVRKQSPTQTAQVVAGASRSSASSGKKVKLTQEDMRLAKKWDIPLEMYAAEKLKIDGADGGYTDVVTKRGG
jgi:hypothetical protein